MALTFDARDPHALADFWPGLLRGARTEGTRGSVAPLVCDQ
ncbi:hypothetical protein [Nocardioides sp. CER19]|nr:hypothetical protein [Nocardioides sp. CER19]MDH2416496.1 hypothetical protein [Nocardioides sp. CER19]